MILFIFSAFLIIATIYSILKDKYLYLFIPCILFLPDYYGIELNPSFPVISVSRLMMVIFFIYVFKKRKRPLFVSISKIKELSNEYIFLGLYFGFRIISNLYYIFTYSFALKTIFKLVIEEIFLLYSLYLLSLSKDEIFRLFKVIIWTATVFFIIGIFESLTKIQPFNALYTVSRDMNNSYYIRLGLLRSTTTFGLSNFYGNMCLLVTPIVFFLYRKTQQKRYLFVIFFDILAIIHSGCRSDMVFFISISILYLLFSQDDKKEQKESLKAASIILIMLATWVLLASLASSHLRYYYSGTAKSILNIVGFNFDLDQGTPSGVEGYGTNDTDATYSRTSQLSGIKYALSVNPLFGLGTGCQIRGDVMFFFHDQWLPFNSIDVGYVEIICAEGIIGLLGYLSLFICYLLVLKKCILKKNKPSLVTQTVCFLILSYLMCLLSTVNMPSYLTLLTALVLYIK